MAFALPCCQGSGKPHGPQIFGGLAATLTALPRPPAEYARRFYYDTLLFDRRALRYLIDMIGARRSIRQSMIPYCAVHSPKKQVDSRKIEQPISTPVRC